FLAGLAATARVAQAAGLADRRDLRVEPRRRWYRAVRVQLFPIGPGAPGLLRAVGLVRALRPSAWHELLRHHHSGDAHPAAAGDRLESRRHPRALGLLARRRGAGRPAPLAAAQHVGLAALACTVVERAPALAPGDRAAGR